MKPDGPEIYAAPYSIPDPNELIRVVLEKHSGEVVNTPRPLEGKIEAQGAGAVDPSMAGRFRSRRTRPRHRLALHNMPAGGVASPPIWARSVALAARRTGLGPTVDFISGLLSGGVSGSVCGRRASADRSLEHGARAWTRSARARTRFAETGFGGVGCHIPAVGAGSPATVAGP